MNMKPLISSPSSKLSTFLFLALLLFSINSPAEALEIGWNNTSGGTFQDASNWNGVVPGVVGTVPAVDDFDTAVFDTGGNSYTVGFNANQANYRMSVRSDDVTLDLNGGTHTIAKNWSRAYIGENNGDIASLKLIDGVADYDREVSVGQNTGSVGMLRVDGATLITDSFKVGYHGDGTAIIENGGEVFIDDNGQNRVWVGLGEGATGSLTVSGVGSRLTGNSGPVIGVGGVYHTDSTGKGSLEVLQGGEVIGSGLSLAYNTSNEGTVLVDGEGSRLDITYVSVGYAGRGTLDIQNSGSLFSSSISIGNNYAGGTGEMNLLRGDTATADKLYMEGLSAELNVTQYGQMSIAEDAFISSWYSDDHSTISVNGENSRLEIGNDLYLGGEVWSYMEWGPYADQGGQATLNVENKGRVSVNNSLHLFNQATVNLNNSGTKGLVTVGDVWPFLANWMDDSGSVIIGNGGVLDGTGTINGNVFNLGGTVGPGFSPGVMTINGDFHLESGGVLDLEIGGLTTGLYDQLLVSGGVFLDGTLNLIFTDDFLPNIDDLLSELITFDSLALGNNFSLLFSGLNNDWQYETLIGADSFSIRSLSDAYAPVPEPSTLLLLACGLVGLAWNGKKRHKA